MASAAPVATILFDQNNSWPDESSTDMKRGSEKWSLQVARAALASARGLGEGALGISSARLYRELWDYAYNRQDIDRYVKLSGIDRKNPLWENESRLPISNRFFQIVTGLIEKAGSKIRVSTIDPQAKIELAQTQAERKARLMMREAMPDMATHPMIAAMPGEPEDLEGLEIMAMGERHPIAADAQDVVRAIFNTNKYPRIRRETIQWLALAGAAVVKDDTEGGDISIRSVDLGEYLTSYYRNEDRSDNHFCGQIRTILISSLPRMSGGKVTQKQLEDLYGQQGQQISDDCFYEGNYNGRGDWWSKAKCRVVDLEIKCLDRLKTKEWKTQHGNEAYGEADEDDEKIEKRKASGKYKYTDTQIENIYRVKWVVGTDIVFDTGKQVNMKRDAKNPARACFSYHVVAPGMREMIPYSRMSAIIPMVDDIQTMNYKRRWTLNRAIPSGYAIDYDGLEDVDLTGGGKAMTKQDLLDYFARSGNLIYRKKGVNGQFKNDGKPIEFLKGGVGDEVVEYSNQIAYNVDLIRQTLGLNDATDGSTVNAKNLNSTNQAMLTGTNNALSDVYFGDKQMIEEVAQSVLIRAQDLLREDEEGNTRASDLAAVVGGDTVQRLAKAPRLDAYEFGIIIEDDPSMAEEEDFNNALNLALQAGQISIDERLMAKTIAAENILQAQLYLAYRVKTNKRQASEEAARREQSNGQLQIQSAQAKAQADQQTEQVKTEFALQIMERKHQMEMELEQTKGAYMLEKERIAATGRVESAFTQAKGRDEESIRNAKTTLIKEGLGGAVGAVDIPADLQSRVEPVTSDEHPALPQTAFSFLKPASDPTLSSAGGSPMPEQPGAPAEMMEPMQDGA